MTDWWAWALGIVIFLLVISISVGLHEAGHMTVARLFKIPVPKFFIGFGPTLWSTKRNGTEYGLKLLPLGGFVSIEDTTQPEGSMERSLLSHVKPWKRNLIFLAGPAVNLVLGTVIFVSLLVATPVKVASTTIEAVDACAPNVYCGAATSGLQKGDKIIQVDGKKVEKLSDMQAKFKESGSEVVVLRDGKEVTLHPKANDNGRLGMNMAIQERDRGVGEAFTTLGVLFKMNLEGISKVPSQVPHVINVISGKEKRDETTMSSMVGVGKAYGDTAATQTETTSDKVYTLIAYSALLNIGLGLANLLPLMPLDGGRMLVAFLDSIRMRWARIRKKEYTPIDYKWVWSMTAVTGSVLAVFMLMLVVADIVAPVSIHG